MASFKTLFLVALAAVAVSLTLAIDDNLDAGSHHLIVGSRTGNDKLIYHENIKEGASWVGKKVIVSRNITAPYLHVITQVKCIDQATDGTGAEPNIVSGGPGMAWVGLRLKSQRFHGVYFNIEVYAKPRY